MASSLNWLSFHPRSASSSLWAFNASRNRQRSARAFILGYLNILKKFGNLS